MQFSDVIPTEPGAVPDGVRTDAIPLPRTFPHARAERFPVAVTAGKSAPSACPEDSPSYITDAERKDRDERLRRCQKMRFTAPQILAYSQTWPRPYGGLRHVKRRLAELGLRAKPKKEQRPHDEETIDAFIKIATDATAAGYRVAEERREFSIGDGSGIRADFRFVLVGKGVSRERFLEVQLSRMPHGDWKRKLEKYMRYRKRKDVAPFRVCVLVEDRDAPEEHRYEELQKAYEIARFLLAERPNMTLFLFDFLPDFKKHPNTVTGKTWVSNRKRREWLL